MAIIKPFKAIRPTNEYVNKVAELPYDVMNREEAKQIAKNNKYSFLHIDRAEIDLDDDVNEHDEKVYIKAKENLNKFLNNNVFMRDKDDAIYIYRQIVNNRSQTGIVACVAVEDNFNGVIKKHEYTKPDKELDRTNHIKYCNANTGTILLTYKNQEEIDKIVDYYVYFIPPIYDFKTDDNVIHTIWKVEKKRDIQDLIKEFDKVENLYIADGHHRCAAAENIALEERRKNPNYTGEEEFNYYTAMIAPDNKLHVMDYNRVVKDLNGLNEEEFLDKVKEKFIVKEATNNYKPNKKGEVGMYLGDKWYMIEFGKEYLENEDVVDSLDISILQNHILDKVLGIKNPRTDKRIDFIGGIRGAKEIEKRVHDDMKVGFLMYPTDIKELISIADENKIMPAKSTWFEPKVRCGLFLHEIS
ncbi:DUF1015 domain-containing protein, partial [Terrisporobacter sp.]|uniref:DUF1015 domain-containing protein n=1 Tax=Terrisporobacter sp. TaxID=1965305 RepID=UPI0026107E7E